MKQRCYILLLPALVMLAAQVYAQNPPAAPDAMPDADVAGLSFDELERERYRYHVERRAQDPGFNPILPVIPQGMRGVPLISSRWAGFIFGVGEDGTFTTKDRAAVEGDGAAPPVNLPWQNIGLNTSGRILSYAFSPPDSAGGRTLWAGSASGGLWKSPDGGDSWEPMLDDWPIMAVSVVAVHPRDPETLLIGTRDSFGYGGRPSKSPDASYGTGVLRTSNEGRDWQTTSLFFVSEPMDANQLVWDPVRPDTVYLAASNGVWQSTDAGRQWQRVLEGNAKSIVLNKRSPDTLYAALYEADTTAGLWHSTDAGAKWHRLTEAPFDADSLSTTCGICMHLTMAEAFPEVVYVSAELRRGDSLYKSSDGGAHWKQVETTVQTEAGEAEAIGFWKAHVSPVDTNVVFVAGVYLYRTLDGGAKWEKVGDLEEVDSLYLYHDDAPASQIHVDHFDFWFDPDRPNTVYDFSDGGVYASTDCGTRWMLKNKGLMTLQLYALGSAPTDDTWLAAATQDQGQLILQIHDPVPRWRKWLTGDGTQVLFDREDDENLYASAQWGNQWKFWTGAFHTPLVDQEARLRNQDGISGSSGQTEEDGLVRGNRETSLWVAPKAMTPSHPDTMYTARLYAVYKTENGGADWEEHEPIDTVSVLAIDHVNPKIVYAYSAKKHAPALWRSLDSGEKWVPLAYDSVAAWPGAYISDLEADPDSAGTLYAVRAGYENQVWRSPDSARTWVNITNNLGKIGGAVPVNTITITPNSTVARKQIYIGTDVGMFMAYADEAPLVWRRVRGGLPMVIVSDSHFHPGDATLRVATYGRGAWIAKVPR